MAFQPISRLAYLFPFLFSKGNHRGIVYPKGENRSEPGAKHFGKQGNLEKPLCCAM